MFSNLDVLFDFGGLTNSVTEVIKLSASDLTLANYFDLLNVGRVDGESLFYANTVRDTANGNSLLNATVLASNNGTLEYLNTLSVAFLDLCVNLNGVTDAEIAGVFLELAFCQLFDEIQNLFSFPSQVFLLKHFGRGSPFNHMLDNNNTLL